jgi:hypothetical protein
MRTLTKRLVMFAAVALVFGAASATVSAAPRRIVVVPHVGFGVHRAWGYDPFWGPPWYPYAYPYAVTVNNDASIKTSVSPKDTEVFVDGYFAGRAGDFDGAFSRLHVVPGGHTISFFLDGFRTVSEDVYVRPNSTFKLDETMTRLRPGETSAPVAQPLTNPTN